MVSLYRRAGRVLFCKRLAVVLAGHGSYHAPLVLPALFERVDAQSANTHLSLFGATEQLMGGVG